VCPPPKFSFGCFPRLLRCGNKKHRL
jgi:hypothetical protein